MAENWICSHCQSFNRQQRDQCWNCGSGRLSPQSTRLETETQPKRLARQHIANILREHWRAGLAIVLLATIVGHIIFQYYADKRNYTNGHNAYQQANCGVAIEYYDKVINDWRLINLGGYLEASQGERIECQPFQAAEAEVIAGNYSSALIAHQEFVNTYQSSMLVPASRKQVELLFTNISPDQLATKETCTRIDSYLDENLIPKAETVLPSLYYSCGDMYAKNDDPRSAFDFYKRLLSEYPDHERATGAETALLDNPLSCLEIDILISIELISQRTDFIPKLYIICGQAHEVEGAFDMAFDLYKRLLIDYADHPLSMSAEAAILRNPTVCDQIEVLEATNIIQRPGFKPTLYRMCGELHQANQDYDQAIYLFEQFLAEYPDHDLATEVEAALAEAIVDNTMAAPASEIPTPERSGPADENTTIVIIQNSSPQQLRIVFRGPESRIKELDACLTCEKYDNIGPLFCPEIGPVGRYELTPGQYDVVVEASSDRGVTPYTGSWELASGDEYSSCFFIVETLIP